MVARNQEVWQGGDSPNALPGWGYHQQPSMTAGDMRALLAQSKSIETNRLMYCVLLMHADRQGFLTARNAQIAEAANLSEPYARYVLYQLRRAGEIECLRRGTRKHPTLWRIVAVNMAAA